MCHICRRFAPKNLECRRKSATRERKVAKKSRKKKGFLSEKAGPGGREGENEMHFCAPWLRKSSRKTVPRLSNGPPHLESPFENESKPFLLAFLSLCASQPDGFLPVRSPVRKKGALKRVAGPMERKRRGKKKGWIRGKKKTPPKKWKVAWNPTDKNCFTNVILYIYFYFRYVAKLSGMYAYATSKQNLYFNLPIHGINVL